MSGTPRISPAQACSPALSCEPALDLQALLPHPNFGPAYSGVIYLALVHLAIPAAGPTLPLLPLLLQFMLGCGLESVEVTATRFFVFQPTQGERLAAAPGGSPRRLLCLHPARPG